MGPTACRRGRPVPRPLGRGSGVLGVGLALVVFLYGSSAAPLDPHEVHTREESEITTERAAMNGPASDIWWWVFLALLVVVTAAIAITCLVACCVVRRSRRRTRQLEAMHLNYQMCSDTHLMSHSESPQKFSTSGNSSSTCVLGPLVAGDHSPQVSSSSLLLFEKSKWRRPSPGHSSGSEEGFKPRGSRSSLTSSHSSVHGVKLAGADSQSSMERAGSGRSGRRRSSTVVHVTKLCDDSNLSLVSTPSTTSMQSTYSTSHASDSSQPTVVEVNVTVGAGSTSQDAQITTAAALAESARQLAQSAAAFGEESDNMWDMYQKRSGAWQMRFRTISNGGYSPASVHRLLSPYPEGASPVADGHLDVYSGLDTPDRGLSQHSASPMHQSRRLARRSSTNGILPHLVHGPAESVAGSLPHGTEACEGSLGSPRLGRRFSCQCHPHDEGWERRQACGHYGSYSPPRRRSGAGSSHLLRQVCQQNGGETVGRELKPTRRVWQDVEVPLNTSPCVTVDSSTESAPSPTQSHGESTVNQPTNTEEVSSQERQPSSSRPKSAPTVGKTASGKQGLSLSQQDTPTSPTTEKVRSELHVPLEEDVGMNFDSNRRSRRPSVHSLVTTSTGPNAKDNASPLRAASSSNLQSKGPSQISKEAMEESERSNTLSRLKRQTSVPNFRHSSNHPTPAATTAGADKRSSHSLVRTSSAVSVGGVESAQSGYLASDGSSLTLDGEQDSAPSRIMVESGEWNGHVDSLVSPTNPLESEIFDSVFEQHIQQCQYSNTSSASSVDQSIYLHRAFSPPLHNRAFSPPLHNRAFSPPLHNRAFSPPLHNRAFSPPLHSRETEKDRLYNPLPRQSTAPSKKLLSSFEYQPRLSPATSNEGVDV